MDSTHQAEPRPLLVSPRISNKDSLPLSPRVCRCLCHFLLRATLRRGIHRGGAKGRGGQGQARPCNGRFEGRWPTTPTPNSRRVRGDTATRPAGHPLRRVCFIHIDWEEIGKLEKDRLGLLGNVPQATPSQGLSRDLA
ncbi:hypothetical protein BHE74_00011482 [Ensete ventricosum]|nr:hypothetical protein BHE74_00011482 [Ensete ventricosum]